MPVTKDEQGNISATAETVTEAKLVIKELKLLKKELALERKQVTARIAEIRADYRTRVADRGSKMQGRGTFMRIMRGFQTASRDADRQRTNNEIVGLEEARAGLDARIQQVEGAIIQFERYVLDHGK